MVKIGRFVKRLKGLTDAVARFPLSAAFLLAGAVINAIAITSWTDQYYKPLMALCVGAVFAAVGQVIYERFFDKIAVRIGIMVASAVLAGGYYLAIGTAPEVTMEVAVKTAVAIFALLMVFIWVPSIRSRVTFNESFLATFKAFFISVFFASVLFLGVSLIIMATDQLLFRVDEDATAHAANIIYLLFATMYFLSLTPFYPGEKEKAASAEDAGAHEEALGKAISCPKFLEILISYIIIPLTAVFTIILLLYIVINIRGSFWSNNLLEPMLVSYSVIVIIVYILACNLENKFALAFRKIFPKVLIPIVLFQTIASVFKIGDMGVTHGRYYVIMFGVFAVFAGVVFSFLPARKNGIIALVLIILSTISIVPPIDAFNIAESNQKNRLEEILAKNGMLEDGKVTANPSVSDEDKTKIRNTFQYLRDMGYTEDIEWLKDKDLYAGFRDMFGFDEYDYEGETGRNIYLSLAEQESGALDIEKYDRFVMTSIWTYNSRSEESEICTIEKNGQEYKLMKTVGAGLATISLQDKEGNDIVSLSSDAIVERFKDRNSGKEGAGLEEMTFITEGEGAELCIVLRSLSIDNYQDSSTLNAELFVFIEISK